MSLNDTFTSTGRKFFHHQEAMTKLKNGKGQPITTHVMLTDVCNHKCAFCSVQARAGDSLAFDDVMAYLDILRKYGLKSVILSGGGNPILYKCKKTGKNFNDVVEAIHGRGLEIGLITNGMPLRKWAIDPLDLDPDEILVGSQYRRSEVYCMGCSRFKDCCECRYSWLTVSPTMLDKLTWIRISMAGLDHKENEVYVPDIDRSKTTLGFSYVGHDIYEEPADPYHGKVSTEADLITLERSKLTTWTFEERIPDLTEQIKHYVNKHHPRYVRLLPNCLEPPKISARCEQLQAMADAINPDVVFVQYKPPASPPRCFLGYVHPVLNSDGYVLPCDSCCLNESSGHKLGEPWRICHWSEIGELYEKPVRSLIKDPKTLCPGCVFTNSNLLLGKVVDGAIDTTPSADVPEHVNFI